MADEYEREADQEDERAAAERDELDLGPHGAAPAAAAVHERERQEP